MSINWVMLDDRTEHNFVKLPGEEVLYSSPSRTSFSLSSSAGAKKLALSSSSGIVHLTSQRIVYIPTQRTRELESFSCPINHLHDTHVAAPFFGANYWTAVVQPVAEGGLTWVSSVIELKLTFKEGGAFDFYTFFERVKELFLQALEAARDQGRPMGNIHLQELPPYEAPPPGIDEPAGSAPLVDATASYANTPMGPPPGYEEAQWESVESELRRQNNNAR
ncbi:hypothetical protein DFP73DRAFT_555436 [Morchella snyderi]|nr:hypothetical protein DFP73DRAFT_555436 [Morchella snyderi]